jgi:hypothetical protein
LLVDNWKIQQHPEDLLGSIDRPGSIRTGPAPAASGEYCGPTRALISEAIVMKACSTFVEFLAEVSKNGIPRPSANS